MTYRRFKFPEIANTPATLATLQENQPENRSNVATVARVYRESTLSPADLADLFEERAAILEYDEGLCRAEAEALARVQIYGAEDRIAVKKYPMMLP